jgi:hypothetical protein
MNGIALGITPPKSRNIALVRYQPEYFQAFSSALASSGFEVYWVNSHRSQHLRLTRRLGVPASRSLDTTARFDPEAVDIPTCRTQLATLESERGPRIYDIILMDRVLRRQPTDVALRYLHHLQRVLTDYFSENSIALITSGRDTALSLMSMLVARRLGIPWVVPTRLRIPRDLYAFSSSHETGDVIRFRSAGERDRAWARDFLWTFRAAAVSPAIGKSARRFRDVFRLMPDHWRAFRQELSASIDDRANRYARHSIGRLVAMYAARRRNMLSYTIFRPYSPPGDKQYVLYALHTQPESSIDVAGSYFSDQIALVTFIARSLPVSHELYVKVHPADMDGKTLAFYRTIARIPGVRLIDYAVDSRRLIAGCDIVFTLTGTIGYEAALLGKPVITFANNFFNRLPRVHRCEAPAKLRELIATVLSNVASPNDDDRIVEVLADLRSNAFEGEVNRNYGVDNAPLSAEDLANLRVAYETLYRTLVVQPGQIAEAARS